MPIEGGVSIPSSVSFSARGGLKCRTPPMVVNGCARDYNTGLIYRIPCRGLPIHSPSNVNLMRRGCPFWTVNA
jgi:hypothetical protein